MTPISPAARDRFAELETAVAQARRAFTGTFTTPAGQKLMLSNLIKAEKACVLVRREVRA